MLKKCNQLKMLVAGLCLGAPLLLLAAPAAEIITANKAASGSQTVLGSTVIPYKEVTVTAQVPGKIVELNGEVGSKFNENDVLIKIDDAQLLAKRNTLWAQITSAQAALTNSKTQYQRELVSPKSKSISGMPGMGMPSMMDIYFTRPLYDMMGDQDTDFNRYSDLQNSATGVSQAESQVAMAYSQLNELTTKIKDTISIAPFEGIVMAKMVEVGDAVQPGQPLMKFGLVKYLRLQADVPSMLVRSLKKGMRVPVTISGISETMAEVDQIYPIADPTRHTVVVKFKLPVGILASPGMYAEIKLPESSSSSNTVIVIPESALVQGISSLPMVLVADTEAKNSTLRLVRLGVKQGNSVVVVSGLKAGDHIINNPPTGAKSGWYPGVSVVSD